MNILCPMGNRILNNNKKPSGYLLEWKRDVGKPAGVHYTRWIKKCVVRGRLPHLLQRVAKTSIRRPPVSPCALAEVGTRTRCCDHFLGIFERWRGKRPSVERNVRRSRRYSVNRRRVWKRVSLFECVWRMCLWWGYSALKVLGVRNLTAVFWK